MSACRALHCKWSVVGTVAPANILQGCGGGPGWAVVSLQLHYCLGLNPEPPPEGVQCFVFGVSLCRQLRTCSGVIWLGVSWGT